MKNSKKVNFKLSKKTAMVIICIISIVIICSLIFYFSVKSNDYQYISYRDFNNDIENEKIESVVIEDNSLKFQKKLDENKYYTDNPNYDGLKEKLLLHGITVIVNSKMENIEFVFNIIFYLFFFGTVILVGFKIIQISEQSFKVVKKTDVNFEDIAGMERIKKRFN